MYTHLVKGCQLPLANCQDKVKERQSILSTIQGLLKMFEEILQMLGDLLFLLVRLSINKWTFFFISQCFNISEFQGTSLKRIFQQTPFYFPLGIILVNNMILTILVSQLSAAELLGSFYCFKILNGIKVFPALPNP